jgi:hypothetical protein
MAEIGIGNEETCVVDASANIYGVLADSNTFLDNQEAPLAVENQVARATKSVCYLSIRPSWRSVVWMKRTRNVDTGRKKGLAVCYRSLHK